MKRQTLPNRHPGKLVARAKVWTKRRSTIEVEGPFDDVQGTLLIATLSLCEPTPEQVATMRKCISALGFNKALADVEAS